MSTVLNLSSFPRKFPFDIPFVFAPFIPSFSFCFRGVIAMASDLEMRAKEAFLDDDFELACDLYTRAIEIDLNNADLYVDRAQANVKLRNFTEAVSDCSKAIELDPSMAKAYLRKGTACMKIEEYQTAKSALEKGFSLSPADSRFTRLIKECDDKIAEEDKNKQESILNCASLNESIPVSEPPKSKYRYDYYNTPTEVVLTIFAKNIPPESVKIDFGEQILSVSINIPGEEIYHFQPRLFAKIIPEKCKFQVLSSKIEIHLSKAESIAWTSLQYTSSISVPHKINSSQVVKADKPAYPSSRGKIDWGKLEAQVKNEEKEEKLEGDAAVNKMFRDIYRDADEDMRRAMIKSFVESNGTVLSTSWKEVGSKKVKAPKDS
ncbi:hypothetical protein LUZ60_008461 [Juncus effusus]|nr:hypothetical protein LUZ60_008461 [Juncus effusus]